MIKIELPTKENLKSLNLSEDFLNFILYEREKINELKYWCEEPLIDWPFYIPETIVRAVCLWSRNGDIEVCWERKDGEKEFVSVYHDDPDYSLIGTEFNIKTDLLIHLIEADDWDDEIKTIERLESIAQKMGYSKFKELNEFHKNTTSECSFESQVAEFISKWQ